MNAPLTDIWSGYSLLRSLWKIPELVEALGARGFRCALLADQETLAGTEEFDRLMRAAGLFPLIGVTRIGGLGPGGSREVRLVAETPEAWSRLVGFGQWHGESFPGLTVVLGPSPMINFGEWDMLYDSSVVVELSPDQESAISRLPPAWYWVPATRVRYAAPGDRGAHELLAQIGGFIADSSAKPLPASYDTWLDPYRHWSTARLWQPEDTGSIFTRHVWKMPRLPGVVNEASSLNEASLRGLAERYPSGFPDGATGRLEYELAVIQELGFAGYFLMVADLVSWAKSQGIRVGPGRGSAAGSLVSFSLHITDVDPLRYGLVFERFLNPARRTLPDIDLDFEDVRRGEVIQYLRERHGVERVAQIGTYGTLGARAALRDVARVMGIATALVSEVLKSVEWGLNDSLSRHAQALKAASAKAQIGPEWIERALSLEGLPRHRSTHAAGVILAPDSLRETLYCHGQSDEGWITDFDMGSLEQLGFVKLDVLGLRTLSTLARIERDLGRRPEQLQEVEGHDHKTLRLLARGDTDGVFQLDGRGVKSLLRQMRPRSLEEVMLVVALYRPGPMDAIQDLLRRRAADYQPSHDDPLEMLLTDTYGIMVYQEQLMAAVQEVAGFTMAEADLVRRAISKKDHAMLDREGQRLLANMTVRGYTPAVAKEFWDRIRAFGDYGFNKSHAASYGLLAYYLAYLKAHHPLQFWAAELSSHDTGERLRELMTQAVSQGVSILPPHVNQSVVGFQVQEEDIVAGLAMIRGVGPEAARRIFDERVQAGPFAGAGDFARRLGRWASERLLEALEQAGALRGLGPASGRASAQMQLFEAATSAVEPEPQFVQAFGFPWPLADGPIYVRVESGCNPQDIIEQIRRLAPRMAGLTPIAVVGDRGRATTIATVRVRSDWAAIAAIKEIEGVRAAGRHVGI